MKIINVKQGSKEWLKLRKSHDCASEAPVMMGDSPYMTRDELLHTKKNGTVKPVSATLQAIFDEGHRAEAAARLILEEIHGVEYPPVVVSSVVEGLNLLASLDGLSIDKIVFEHKMANDDLLMKTVCQEIEAYHYWQLEQQLLVSGSERVCFVVSDGTKENKATLNYVSIPERRKKLIAGWKQFKIDLENFEAKPKKETVIAETIDGLPKLSIIVSGNVEDSNLPTYQNEAEKYIRAIKTNLETDQDFADADKTVKFLSAMEKSLDESKQRAIDGTADIREVYIVIDNLKALSRSKRLSLDKLVKSKKEAIRGEIISRTNNEFHDFCNEQEKQIWPGSLNIRFSPFEAMKGKKTVESLENAANTELAKAKIEATEQAILIRKNFAEYSAQFISYKFLFTDLGSLLHKEHDDFCACSRARIDDYEKKIAAQEVERKEQEEKEKARQKELEKLKATTLKVVPEKRRSLKEPAKSVQSEPEKRPFTVCPHCNEKIF